MYSVQCSNLHNMEYYHHIEPLLQEFANIFKTNVNTFNPHAKVVVPEKKDGELKIIFYAAYGTSTWGFSGKHYRNVFGVRLQGDQIEGITPSKNGIPIYDQENIIAEYIDGSLFVLFDLIHNDNNLCFVMFKILENFVIQGLMKDVPRNELVILEESLQRFQKYISYLEFFSFYQTIPQELKEKAAKIQEKVALVNRDLISLYRQKENVRMALSYCKEHPRDPIAEFESLKEIAEIESFSTKSICRNGVNKRMIVLFTKPITIEHRRQRYSIGSFKIEIDFSGDVDAVNVKCFNLTRRIDDCCDHPHILDNICCFGNITEVVPKLIANYSLADLARLLICYLQSYTDDDRGKPYRNIGCWPLEM